MLIYIWCALVFLVGVVIGSGLNVLIFRLAARKSAFWPSSHCFTCLNAIRWYDNIPIIGYLILRGRCRHCGTHYSARYLWVEVLTGVLFLAAFYLIVLHGHLPLPTFKSIDAFIWMGAVPMQAWWLIFLHGVWLFTAVVAYGCASQSDRIPVSIGITMTTMALVIALQLPWPWPTDVFDTKTWLRDGAERVPLYGVQVWPFRYPPPEFAPAYSLMLGFMNWLCGIIIASVLMRVCQRPTGETAYALSVAGLFGWQVFCVIFLFALWLRLGWRTLAQTLPLATIMVVLMWGWIGPLLHRLQH